MKKVFAFLFVTLMTTSISSASVSQIQAANKQATASVLVIAKAIKEAVGGAMTVYKTAPEAEYYMLYKAKDGKVAYLKANSATKLVNMAYAALNNGEEEAEYVILSSVYPSVKGFCLDWGRKYYKHDSDELLKCL